MKIKHQSPAISFLILSAFILSCGPLSQAAGTPSTMPAAGTAAAGAPATGTPPTGPQSTPVASPDLLETEAFNAQPQLGDVISPDNAAYLAEISSFGKGSGHHPIYSPDGKVFAVSSSSGIYLYDASSFEEKMVIAQGVIRDMAFSTDGKTLSTVVETYEAGNGPGFIVYALIQQWDLAGGSLLQISRLETDGPFEWYDHFAVFSPDGKTLASNVVTGTVKLWDAASGQELLSFSNPYFYGPLVFSLDSKTLAATDFDGVTLWDVSTRAEIRRIVTGPDLANPAIISLAFSPDGRLLATGSESNLSGGTKRGTVQLWDLNSGSQLDGFSRDIGDIAFDLSFSPDSTILAARTSDGIKLWDAAGGNELLSWSVSHLESFSYSPDGETLISSSSIGDDSVKLWGAATGDLLFTLTGDNAGGIPIWSADSLTLAWINYGVGDYAVTLRNVASGEVRSLRGHPSYLEGLAFSPDGRTLATSSMWNAASQPNDLLKLWDTASGQVLHTLDGHSNTVANVAFSPDGTTLASTSWDGTIKLWDVASGSELRTLSGNTGLGYSVAFSPDGKILASAFNDSAGVVVKLWDVAGGSELRTLSVNTDGGLNVAFSPDGKVLVLSNYFGYGLLQMWDVASGQELPSFNEDAETLRSFAFSLDGGTLAIGSEDGTVTLWDLASGQVSLTLSGHTTAARGLAFSPDGGMLVSGDSEAIKLWELASGGELASLSTADVYSLAFSPDGRMILVRSFRGVSLLGVSP